MSKYLQSDIAGPIATITLTRPDTRNAINPELLADLSSAITAADDDPDISVICLRAVGPVFSAGGDLQGLRGGAVQPIRPEESVQLARALEPARRLLASNKPSIALVQGAAVGGGLALAMACDFRIASPDAKFAYAYGRIGLAGDLGATWLLSHLLGPHGAYRFAMRGLVLAHEAQTLGLIDAVADDLEVELGTLVDQILAVPSGAAAAIKSNLRSVQTMSFDEAGSLEAATFQRLRVSPDHVEAIDAFLERRSPRFTGK